MRLKTITLREGRPVLGEDWRSPSRFHDTHGMPEQHVALVVLQG